MNDIDQLLNKDKMMGYALMVEFGYLGCEKGWNLERTIEEFYKVMKGENQCE